MDLVKYLIIGVGCLFIGIIISILARNIFAGLGFTLLSFFGYVLWSYFNYSKDN
jgi:hypothetical protein